MLTGPCQYGWPADSYLLLLHLIALPCWLPPADAALLLVFLEVVRDLALQTELARSTRVVGRFKKCLS